MFNVLNRLFQVGNLVYMNGKQSVEWDLPIDIGLSLHEATSVSLRSTQSFLNCLLLFLPSPSFLLREILGQALIAYLDCKLSNDAIGTLAVGSAV